MQLEIAGGDTAISIIIRRRRHGVQVDVKVSPDVEGFFQHWGGQRNQEVRLYGGFWKPLPDRPALRVWDMMDVNDGDWQHQFTLSRPGRGLQDDEGRINLSFIRLVGASEGDGVSLLIDDVISSDLMMQLGNRMKMGAARFVEQFIKPVDVQVRISCEPLAPRKVA